MSRDSFDFEDFRDSDWGSQGESYSRDSCGFGRDSGRVGSFGAAGRKRQLEQIRVVERDSDRFNALAQRETSPSAMSANNRGVPDERSLERDNYYDRDRVYSLRSSEVRTLTEVAKFRVIQAEDLAQFAYSNDAKRMESDLRNLSEQGLIEKHETSPFKKESRQVLTLTKRGHRLIRANRFVPEDQAIYSGLVKPKEAEHDSDLYRLYQKAAEEIERKGGKVLRVQLDYELKEQLYRKLGSAQARLKEDVTHLKKAFAEQLHLPVVNGKVSLPDLRIEYTNQHMEISRVDLELATGHYHAGHLAEKARAGFQIYARSEDAAGLRRVRDDREITTAILSL